jgi:hypothetical protein
MLKQWMVGAACAFLPLAASALQPYIAVGKADSGNIKTITSITEQKLVAGGFTVIGRYMLPALNWSWGKFMGLVNHPDTTRKMLAEVAGVQQQ